MPHRSTPGRRRPAAATRPDVVVVGGGMAGLVAARELMSRGLQVTVLEAAGTFGGCVAARDIGGLTLDSGAESYSTRSDTVPRLAKSLGLGDRLVAPNPAGAWIQLPGTVLARSAQRLPASGILGIPADVMDPDVVRAVGRPGALRASLDRVLPLGHLLKNSSLSLGEVVRARMGVEVLTRLVAPVVSGVFSADPESLDVDSAAPGLRAAMKQHGSLGAAVGALRRAAPAGSAVGGLDGGMAQLTRALVGVLESGGAELLAAEPVISVVRAADGWTVATDGRSLSARALVVATDGPAAVGLLGASLPALERSRPASVPGVALVTLVVDVPQLDAHPRGTGVLVAAGVAGVKAKALTHATAKWRWLADRTGPGGHVLRLSYGRAEGPSPSDDDGTLYRTALADASALLDTQITEPDVVDWDVVRWNGALPHAAVGHRDMVARVRAAAAPERGLELVGGWLAGTGLVAVIDDAASRAGALAGRMSRGL